jgi:hypothetical protein
LEKFRRPAIVERITRFRRHFNAREALIGALLSDFDLRDFEIPTTL